jgi:hypothetical protein
VDFVFAYLGQLTNIPARLRDMSGCYRFCRIAGEFVEASNIACSSGKGLRCAMSSLRELEACKRDLASIAEQLISVLIVHLFARVR